uniref:Amidase n=1 Tax=uncultured microorganism TaxID=358574 RepID=K0J3S4_9ZZZZ|nr:amidase [uncultured microorganism]
MEEPSILELGSRMASGEMTAHSLAEYYLHRIETIDRSGPSINSVIELNPDALSIAGKRDRERAAGKLRGPLHGIPILIKDNIDTRDRMQTTAGSLALEGSHALRDAFIVKRLRISGAVILGKTNLSEWANFRGKRSISGWSSRGGLTRNPYVLDRSACGSSSGSAAAVSANLCAAAIGTETDGSIICPSQTCGVVGLKPTLGLISRIGIVPIAKSQDTAGPIGRTVEDVALLLSSLVGVDKRDHSTQLKRRRAFRNYSKFLTKDGLAGARVGVARNMLGSDERIIRILEICLGIMKQLGAVIIDPANLPNADTFGETEVEVLLNEFKYGLNSYLSSLGPRSRVHSLDEVIKFNEENKDRVMPYFGQERMIAANEKGPLSSKEYRQALSRNRRLTRREGIDALIKSKRLDAIVVISGGPAWLIDMANGDPRSWDMESTSPAAVAGYPHITVPGGHLFGLPIGVSFFSKAWSEPTLLRIAYSFEQALMARKPPRFLSKVDVNAV